MKAEKISTPSPQELQSLFELPCAVEVQPRLSAAEAPEAFQIPEPPLELPAVPDLWGGINEALTEVQRAKHMREWIVSIFPAAILALRKKLGRSQWEICHLLGCTTSAYQGWEKGSTMPSGQATLMLLRLCPDRESLRRFGLDV
jgi:DNA-binding transcriptional regulator YiaG